MKRRQLQEPLAIYNNQLYKLYRRYSHLVVGVPAADVNRVAAHPVHTGLRERKDDQTRLNKTK